MSLSTQKAVDAYKLACLQKRAVYETNPQRCVSCLKVLSYEKRKNKFCSHSCAATVNNIGIRRNVSEGTFAIKPCAICKKPTKNICCSRSCNKILHFSKRWAEIEKTGSLINYSTDKQYLIHKRGHKCEICSIVEWMGQKAPLVLDHKDGNSDNNLLDNVRLICHNCNAQTDTFCGKNKGKGRHSKRIAYRKKQI